MVITTPNRHSHQDNAHRRQEETEHHDHQQNRRQQGPFRQLQRDDPMRGGLAEVQIAHDVRIEQRHPDDQHQHRRLAQRAREDRRKIPGPPHLVDHCDQQQRKHGTEPRRFRGSGIAPVQSDHYTD
jgi:hypothetical protein